MAASDKANLLDPQLIRDPFRGYAELREQGRLIQAEFPGLGQVWLATRYEDLKAVLSDSRFVRDSSNVPGVEVPDLGRAMLSALGIAEEYYPYLLTNLAALDAPEHTRLRKLVSRAFTARRVKELRPQVERITEDLLDRLPDHAEDGAVDLLAHFAYPLPITVIGELVGVPERDRALWKEMSGALMQNLTALGSAEQGDANAVVGKIVGYCHDMIAQRRKHPADDLVTAMIQAQEEDGDRLNDTEMVMLIFALVFAGHETTANLIGNGTVALLTHSDQWARLKRDRDLVPRAVHEMLRWCGVITLASKVYASEDVELNGTLIRKGEAVTPALVGANFDPRMFDEPERFDITRATDGRRETHVAFSHGPHYCLGAALARQEGEVAFEALLGRYPDLALAVDPHALPLDAGAGLFRYASIPVRIR